MFKGRMLFTKPIRTAQNIPLVWLRGRWHPPGTERRRCESAALRDSFDCRCSRCQYATDSLQDTTAHVRTFWVWGFTSQSTQNTSFRSCSSEPTSWLVLKKLNLIQQQQTFIQNTKILQHKINTTRNVGQCPTWWHPAEYRWHPLFNTAKFGWRPILECRAVTLSRRETHWNLQECPN